MQAGAQKTQSLVLVGLVLRAVEAAAELDAATEEVADVLGRRHDAGALVGNVVLHARVRVDAELRLLVDGPAQAAVVAARVLIVGVVLRVVDVVLGPVAAEPVGRHLELPRAVAKGQEAEDAQQQPDRLGRHRLDRAHVDCLRVVAQPVAKVDARDVELAELLAAGRARHHDLEEDILNVTMAPWDWEARFGPVSTFSYNQCVARWPGYFTDAALTVLSLDFGDGSNVSGSKGMGRTGPEKEDKESHAEVEWFDREHCPWASMLLREGGSSTACWAEWE